MIQKDDGRRGRSSSSECTRGNVMNSCALALVTKQSAGSGASKGMNRNDEDNNHRKLKIRRRFVFCPFV